MATVDIPSKAAPLEAGDPVEATQVTQMGSTFAERAAAAKKAEAKPAAKKAVKSDAAEDKAVSSSESKTRKKA